MKEVRVLVNKRLKKLRDKHFYIKVNDVLCRALLCSKRKRVKFRTRSTYIDVLVIKTLYPEDYGDLNLDLDKSIVTVIDADGVAYKGLYRGGTGTLDHQYGLSDIEIELYN